MVKPVALAPEPGGPQVVGEASGAAEAFGIRAGMRLSEALSRCPGLRLAPPDSERAAEKWEQELRRLESIGASVEPARPGAAFFEAEGLRPLCGGSVERVLRRAQETLEAPARLGAGTTRLVAHAAALRARPRRGPVIVPAGAAGSFLTAQPVALLREGLGDEWERATVPDTLERLGVRTLGELAELPDAAVADRFGEPGLRALRAARGEEPPLRPRPRGEDLIERLELPEACSGTQLERALEMLVGTLLANPARRRRTVRRLRLGAALAGGGSWRTEATLREASADRERLRLALEPKLAELPGPATALSLRALDLGQVAHEQPGLERTPGERRRARLGEAVRQVRAAGGREAVLRVLDVDPGSRVPERRMVLTPFEGEAAADAKPSSSR
jgi:protein ImuB